MNLISRVIYKILPLFAVSLLLVACAGNPFFQKDSDKLSDGFDPELKAQFEQALLLQKNGDFEQAASSFEKLHQRYPDVTGPLANLGVIAMQQKQPNDAERYFLKALEINTEHKQILNYLGVLAREGGQFEQAERYYRQALEVDPDYPDAVRNLGILLDLYRGRLEEAIALYEQYQQLQTEPDSKVKDWIFDTRSRLNQE